jgi:hypothetical protein
MVTGHSLEHPAEQADPSLGDFEQGAAPRSAAEWRKYQEHGEPPANLDRVLRAVRLSDTSPPLYYVLLHGWTRLFGTGDVTVRLFSVAWSLACLPLLVKIARRMGGGRAVLASATFFAFSPMIVYYSGEARMYALLWFLVLALMLLTLRLEQRGFRWVLFSGWIVVAAAGFLTHYFFLFPLLAAVGYLLLQPGRLARWQPLIGAVVAGALVLPWYADLPAMLSAWRVTGGWLHLEPFGFRRAEAITKLFTHFFTGDPYGLWRAPKTWNLAGAILFALIGLVAALRLRGRWVHGQRLLMWLWFGAVCLGPLAYDLLQGTYMLANPRYISAALPALCLIAGVAVSSVRWSVQLVVLGFLVLFWLPSLATLYRKPGRSGPPVRVLAQTVSAQATAEDLILVHSIPSGVLAVARYSHGPAPIAAWVEQLGERVVPDSLLQLAAGRARIHFVRFHDLGAPAPEEDWLREHARVVGEQWFFGTMVTVFAPRDSDTF